MSEHHITVPRTARYYTSGTWSSDTTEVWVVCHGYSQLAQRFLTYFEALESPSRLVIAPEALSRFYVAGSHGKIGATWMTKEDRDEEINDYVRYLDAVVADATAGGLGNLVTVHALGFSQGVATACRWAARGQTPIKQLVLWAETLPPEFRTFESVARLADMQVDVVCGTDDEYISAEAQTAHIARLTTLQLPHRQFLFEGGHRLDRNTLRQVAGVAG